MKTSRRTFLRNAVVLGVGTIVLPSTVLADRPIAAFQTDSVDHSLDNLFKDATIEATDQITIKAPEIAENGRVVPIEIKTDLTQVESITVLADKNPRPLVARFKFNGKVKGWVKTNIKMGGTSNVIAVVKADGKLYKASKEVKITIGGCGG